MRHAQGVEIAQKIVQDPTVSRNHGTAAVCLSEVDWMEVTEAPAQLIGRLSLAANGVSPMIRLQRNISGTTATTCNFSWCKESNRSVVVW